MGNKHLDGKVTLILGAAGKDNMAQVMARRFAKEGAKLVLAGRNEDALRRFLKNLGGHTVFVILQKKKKLTPWLKKLLSVMAFFIPLFKQQAGDIYHHF